MSVSLKPEVKASEDLNEQIKDKIRALPAEQRVRAIALYSLYLKKQQLDEEMEKEIEVRHLEFLIAKVVEKKFDELQKPLVDCQMEIISGARNPTSEELGSAKSVFEDSSYEEALAKMQVAPVANYWTKVFKNCEILQEELKEKDEPIMNHCEKITFEKSPLKSVFTFSFAPNAYFTNQVLSKSIYFSDP